MPPFVFEYAGFLGVAFYLGSYAALQSGLLRGAGYAYAILNLIAASLVLLSLMQSWNLASVIIQVSWIVISIVGLTRVWVLTRQLRFSDEERAFLDTCFPTLGRLDARRLLDAGRWVDGAAGDVLTKEHAPVTRLSYIAQGGAAVAVDGQQIATIGPGQFVGEMNCLTEGPASASVWLDRPSRYFAVSSDMLRRQIQRNPAIEPHLHFAFSGHTQAKLLSSNAALSATLRTRAAEGA